jgi:hypothetical protein
MSAWNFMSYESKGNLLEAVRREAAGMFALAEEPETWMAPTGAGDWQVRDVFGHLIDTTETYFLGFDAARKGTNPPESAPLRDMATHVDRGARQFRTVDRKVALDRLSSALDRTPVTGPDTQPIELGIRITSGANAGNTRVAVGPEGATTTPGPIDDLPCVIEFDPGSFVLTAYGRTNAGTARGDRDLAHRFLGGFFRI